MKKRQSIFIFTAIMLPLLISTPLIFNLAFPKASLFYLQLSYCFLAYTVFYFFSGKNDVHKHPAAPAKFSGIILFLIQLFITALLAGQLLTLGQYQFHEASNIQHLMPWVNHAFNALLGTGNLFFWGLVSAIIIMIHTLDQKKPTLHLFSNTKNLPFKKNKALWQRVIEIYVNLAGMFFISATLAFTILQISLLIYPKFSSLYYPLLGATFCGLLFIIGTLNSAVRIFAQLHKRSFNLFLFFLALILMISILLILFSWGGYFLFQQHEKNIAIFSPLHLYPHLDENTLTQLYLLSTWILITPFIASLILHYSKGRKIKSIVANTLVLPCLFFVISFFNRHDDIQSSAALFNFFIALQGIGFLGLLLLSREKIMHQILWFGFALPTTPKKSRVVQPILLWVQPTLILVLFSLGSISTITALYFLISSLLLLILFINLGYLARNHKSLH